MCCTIPSVAHPSKCTEFFQVCPIFFKGGAFFQVHGIFFYCGACFQVWRIFPSLRHFCKCVAHLSKRDAISQFCRIFLRVAHFSECGAFCLSVLHFFKCGACVKEWQIFVSLPIFKVWCIFLKCLTLGVRLFKCATFFQVWRIGLCLAHKCSTFF